ncbi:GNAT family N-acetyltransferase [Nocardioides sp. DS6]|uniref:GNAT family N-acetyltransferase n=1 Tax=Nocardioides eburneus TaxID=3231482 RepID=A0ABV3SV01_9ACTN
MSALDSSAVVAASNAWVWYPDDATVVDTDDRLLVRWPDHVGLPPTLNRFAPAGDLEEAFGEVVAQVRAWGDRELVAWVRLDCPAGLEDLLRARGGRPEETVDVFAQSLAGVRDLHVPAGIEVRWRNDPETIRDGAVVSVAAFGEGTVPDDERARKWAAEYAADHAVGRGGSVVVYVDGRPAGTGGLTLADGVARLWGGATHPDLRGHGAYRAVLAARLAYAADHGATMALVKGRVETSGPILRRAGFEAFGQERSYRLPLLSQN